MVDSIYRQRLARHLVSKPRGTYTADNEMTLLSLKLRERTRLYTAVDSDAVYAAVIEQALQHNTQTLIVTTDSRHLRDVCDALAFFAPTLTLHTFPDWEVLPYDRLSPHADIIAQRLHTLWRLRTDERAVVITTISALMQPTPPPRFIDSACLIVNVGDRLSPTTLVTRLAGGNYRRVNRVEQHGEFAVRGSIIDIFPSGVKQPLRLDFFDDVIDSIRDFDPATQHTIATRQALTLLPAREIPTDEVSLQLFANNATLQWGAKAAALINAVTSGHSPPGVEQYLPLFFAEPTQLTAHLSATAQLLLIGDTNSGYQQQLALMTRRYNELHQQRPTLPPALTTLPEQAFFADLNRFARCDISTTPHKRAHALAVTAPPSLAELLVDNTRLLCCAASESRKQQLLALLRDAAITPVVVADWHSFFDGDMRVAVTTATIRHGCVFTNANIAIVSDHDLLPQRSGSGDVAVDDSSSDDAASAADALRDLCEGDLVVHEHYGVGRYQGLVTRAIGDSGEQEYLQIAYADDSTCYLPAQAIHLLSRYAAPAGSEIALDGLSKQSRWQKHKAKVIARIRDVAGELLALYARRALAKADAMIPDEALYTRFANAFLFEETPDQRKAIDAVLNDLGRGKPMDRLIAGDVGFGKTEVAMRAACAVAAAGKQVMVLAPTALLANQHEETFTNRFADFPITIASMTRHSDAASLAHTRKGLSDGSIDIVIGTHKLLRNMPDFHDLGLVVIDEEHRFGINDKERIKRYRANAHVLTLTATPIPRTMSLAMEGLRDLSIIATPPKKRVAVTTFRREWDDAMIVEACQRELHRSGQVYFIHNDIVGGKKMVYLLQQLLPDARIDRVHGQMPGKEVAAVMRAFYQADIDILVCTTIVESGIDNPNANTIIINAAHMFGLAELHQLRGRVGRSHHQAYAYLIAPPDTLLTAEATARLDAVTSADTLGSGFLLAIRDLEIRGAGQLLGDEQSGHIDRIGVSLYHKLLSRTVHAMRSGSLRADDELLTADSCDIDLGISCIVPADYVEDVHTRLQCYQAVANATDDAALRRVRADWIDRFGALPAAADNLLTIASLRLQAQALGITRIRPALTVTFGDVTSVQPQTLLALIRNDPARYRMAGGDTFIINCTREEKGTIAEVAVNELRLLAPA